MKRRRLAESEPPLTVTDKTKSLMVSVILARETIDNPWEDCRWRPLEVLIGVSDMQRGAIVKEGEGFVHYFAGTFPIELHRKDTPAYVANLETATPSVYVVACEVDDDEAESGVPYEIRLVTVSPFEAQDFLDTGEDVVEAIEMVAPLQAWLEDFVAAHHVEEKFIKRRRDRVDLTQEKFGQEPIEMIRRRQKRRFDA